MWLAMSHCIGSVVEMMEMALGDKRWNGYVSMVSQNNYLKYSICFKLFVERIIDNCFGVFLN